MTDFYADYIRKTTFDPETNSVRSKLVEERGAPNSECCDAPLKRYNNGTGLCSDCGEHAGPVKDEQKEAATDMKKKPASKTPKVEVEPTEIPEEYGEGEKSHITSHLEKKYGGRGGPGGSGVIHVGSHNGLHAYNTETENFNDTHNSYAIHNEKTGKTHEVKIPGKVQTAAQVHKHIKPHGGSSTLAKHIANDHNSMHENVQEKLHGDQHKLDHNHDMKITASDMKMVRKKGAVKNHPMEAEEKPAPVIIKSKKSPARLRRDAASRPMGVREDDLSEVDTDTMKSYMKKAKKQAVSISQKPNVNKDDMRKFGNRVKGVSMAQKKLGEDQELEEGSFKVNVEGLPTMYIDGSSAGEIKSQLRKKFKDPKAVVSIERITPAEKKKELRAKVAEDQAAVDAFLKKGGTIKKLPAAHARSTSDMEKDVKGRVDTSRFKTKGKVKSMEDVEHVDELSKQTLGSYSRVAARDVAVKTGDSYRAIYNRDKKAEKEADRKRDNRYKGIDLATKKLQKEGAMKRIATNDAEKERLGPRKVKGDGLDTFKKKPMGEKFANAAQQAAVMAKLKASGDYKKPKESVEEKDTHVTKDGRTAKKGLWYNIHKKRERGGKPNPPGHPDRPSKADFKRSQN